MPDYGLLPTGFSPKPLLTIREELNAALRSAFGASLDLGDRSIIGQLVGILAERYSNLWDLMQAVYSSQDTDSASAAALDALCILTGTTRPQAAFSTAPVVLTGDPATLVPAGSGILTTSTGKRFTTDDAATITVVASRATTTYYAVGDRVTAQAAAVDRVYQCITSGTTNADANPLTFPFAADPENLDITDGTVHWTYVGLGTAAIDVDTTAEVTGSVTAVARDLAEIDNPVLGWETAVNLIDATTGRDLATDEELRELREAELGGIGHGTVPAIKAALLDIDGVISATVYYNNTDLTDADGLPPHSVECMVRTAWDVADTVSDQAIHNTLFNNVAAGIVTHGDVVGTVTDEQGTDHTFKFRRPTPVPIYVTLTIIKDAALYPSNGDTLVQEAIVAWGAAQRAGKDAVSAAISARAFQVSGVLDVDTCYIGIAPSPSAETTIEIGLRELATYDATRIIVVSSDGEP